MSLKNHVHFTDVDMYLRTSRVLSVLRGTDLYDVRVNDTPSVGPSLSFVLLLTKSSPPSLSSPVPVCTRVHRSPEPKTNRLDPSLTRTRLRTQTPNDSFTKSRRIPDTGVDTLPYTSGRTSHTPLWEWLPGVGTSTFTSHS